MGVLRVFSAICLCRLFSFACNSEHSQNTAADAQKRQPQNGAAVTGLGRAGAAGLRGLTSRAASGTGRGNFNCRFLIAADGTFLVLRALLGCGGFLVGNPLEGVRRRVRLVPAGTLMPVTTRVCLPLRTRTMGMAICHRCLRRLRLAPKALRVAVIADRSVVHFPPVDL